jgi:FkbH-like protein
LQVRLTDTYGDNGMISVVICHRQKDAWEIDTWLMSCRVLGRGVENMVLQEISQQAQLRGVRRLVGTYRPTGRNELVRDHYAKLGFAQTSEAADGTTVWEWNTGTAIQPAPMVVHREGRQLVGA